MCCRDRIFLFSLDKRTFRYEFFGIDSINAENSGSIDFFGVIVILFLIPIIICLSSKSKTLRRAKPFWTLLFPGVASLIALLFFFIDLQSSRVDILLDIKGASDFGLHFGQAPYLILIIGISIIVFGIALKSK